MCACVCTCVSVCVCLCVSVLQQGEPPGATRWATARAALGLGMKATGHGHGVGFLASEKPLSLGWQEEKPQEPKPPVTPERQGPRRHGGSAPKEVAASWRESTLVGGGLHKLPMARRSAFRGQWLAAVV